MADESNENDESEETAPTYELVIAEDDEGEVEGFLFGPEPGAKFADLMPRVDPGRAPLRSKDQLGARGAEAPWTTWRKGG